MGKNRLYGIGEPLTMDALRGKTTPEDGVRIMKDLGVTAFREWMDDAMAPDPGVYEKNCRMYDRTLELCHAADIEVTGVAGPVIPGNINSGNGMPCRDLSPDSPYRNVLSETEKHWKRIAARFPDIRQWEVGNEWNFELFMHPVGWKAGGRRYSIEEMMLIACDLMFVSAKGLREGNPRAEAVSVSLAGDALHRYLPSQVPIGYGIAAALNLIYENIKSGKSFSTDPDDYFDLVAWHPYLSTQMGYAPHCTEYPAETMYLPEDLPDALWKSYSDMAYNVMAEHGDGKKKVLLTEFGFSDCGDPKRDRQQADLIPQCFDLLGQMPYVKTCHFFRLFEEEDSTASSNGIFTSESEAHFGIVRERIHGYAYKERAKALKKVYHGGGKGKDRNETA